MVTCGLWDLDNFFLFVWITMYRHENKSYFQIPKMMGGMYSIWFCSNQYCFLPVIFWDMLWLNLSLEWFLTFAQWKKQSYSLFIKKLKWGKESCIFVCFAFYLEHCDLWKGLLFLLFYSGCGREGDEAGQLTIHKLEEKEEDTGKDVR